MKKILLISRKKTSSLTDILVTVDDATTNDTGTVVYTKNSTTSYDCEVTVAGGSASAPALTHTTESYLSGITGKMTFIVSNLTGEPIVYRIHAGSHDVISQPIVSGINTVNFTTTAVGAAIHIYLDGRKLFNIEVTDVKILI